MSDSPFFDHDGLVEEQQREDEERGDICMALRDLGYGDEADWIGGEPIENCRRHFEERTGVEWNWEAQQDRWVAQAMQSHDLGIIKELDDKES